MCDEAFDAVRVVLRSGLRGCGDDLVRAGGPVIEQVLGEGPFYEIGVPEVASVSPDGSLVAVGGAQGRASWLGRDTTVELAYAAAVYRTADLGRVVMFQSRWPVNTFAFHPTLPLVVVGTGAFDGGYRFEGQLTIMDLADGRGAPLLANRRMVVDAAWRDAETLDLVLKVPTEEDEPFTGDRTLRCSIRRRDWAQATSEMLREPFEEMPAVAPPRPGPPATEVVAALCRDRGRRWQWRGPVCALHAVPGGGLLVARAGDGVQRWAPGGDEQLWRRPVDGVTHQLYVAPDGRTALALTHKPSRFAGGRWHHEPGVLLEIDLADGSVTATHRAPFPAVLVVDADGRWALRNADFAAGQGEVWGAASVVLGRYDAVNHQFDIRYAPELLFLQGRPDKPRYDQHVVAVDAPGGAVRRLFPLEWDGTRGDHLGGGPGAYLDGMLVHGATRYSAGRLLGHFVVGRAYPTGEPRWVFRADYRPTELDAAEGRVFVTLQTGELVVLNAADGAVINRRDLMADWVRLVPLSLAALGGGRVAVGLLDSRVLVLRP